MTRTASANPAAAHQGGAPVPTSLDAVPRGSSLQRPAVGNGSVVIYLVLSIMALVPGLALMAGLEPEGHVAPGQWLAALKGALTDIRFGSGLRFWLGVAGATLMGLLLLYPVRKAFAQRFRLGSIAGWFHLHILFGLAGPVLILYHCNFGLGALNANVALWTMLAIAVSGIVGHFVYARVSADYWSEKRAAREHLDAAIARLRNLAAVHPGRTPTALIERLEDVETAMLRPRAGLAASTMAMREAARQRRDVLAVVGTIVADCSREKNWPAATARQHLMETRAPLERYFRLARSAARRSIGEQLWARWRLFHLPLFLIMTVATILHIVAVWGMDDGAAPTETPPVAVEANAQADPGAPSLGTRAVASASALPKREPRSLVAVKPIQTQTIATIEMEPPAPLVRRAGSKPPPKGGDQIAQLLGTSETKEAGEPRVEESPVAAGADAAPKNAAVAADKQVAPAAPAVLKEPPKRAPQAAPRMAEATSKPEPNSAPAPRVTPPKPATVVTADVKPATMPSPAADMKAVYSELQRKTETAQMGLGAPKEKSLAEQIRELKAKRFAHAESETGFPLTGKHTRVDCIECHKAPLLDRKPDKVRGCIACHRSDDVHRGRRPDCARCHTTNRWSEIIRRR